jgi:hypothetical protein
MATRLYKTVKPSGGDYTSLEACVHANEKNLVTADQYFDIEIDGDWSSAEANSVTIHNYTTDATRYINIYTTAACRHPGNWDTSKYRIDLGTDGYAMQCAVTNLRLTGLQVNMTWAGGGDFAWPIRFAPDTPSEAVDIRINRCILRSDDTPGLMMGVGLSGTYRVANTIVYNQAASAGRTGIEFSASNWDTYCYIYNCTVHGYGTGIAGTGGYDPYVKGCLFTGNTADTSSLTEGSCDYNVTDNSSLGYAAQTHDHVSHTFTFEAGTHNFHLAAGDTGARGLGVDLSGDTYWADSGAYDIDGQTRSGSWDVGADQYVTTGQYSRPTSDIADGGWLNESSSNTNLYASIDEVTASDADYIRSGATPADDTCTVGITGIVTPDAGTVTMRIRARTL